MGRAEPLNQEHLGEGAVARPLLSVFLVLFLASSCTFGGVTPISVAPPPPKRPPALIIGEVQAANPLVARRAARRDD